ncbi:MAG: hypothetical protein M3R51_05465 [Candidatus Eremiobacteraeota bacterium]|nr:hypothetical protein [Candidatus Eremiobacteraeota bacterium]
MHSIHRIVILFAGGLAFAALGACSSGSQHAADVVPSNIAPLASRYRIVNGTLGLTSLPGQTSAAAGWLSDEAKSSRHLLYVSDQPGQTVYIFPEFGKNPKPIGAITAGIGAPEGLFVDQHLNLYVCNFGLATVTVYPQGKLTPSKTLTQAGAAAFDVVVGLDSTVYVSNFNEGSNGQIVEYAHGSTTPTTTINFTGYPEGVALDSHNNLYVAYQKSSTIGTVLKFAPGSTTPHDLNLPITLVGGMTIDNANNIIVADQSNPQPHVDVFPPGSKIPSKMYPFALNFNVALNAPNDHLYVTQPDSPPTVWEIAYPSGTPIQSITNTISSAFGVATSPEGSR